MMDKKFILAIILAFSIFHSSFCDENPETPENDGSAENSDSGADTESSETINKDKRELNQYHQQIAPNYNPNIYPPQFTNNILYQPQQQHPQEPPQRGLQQHEQQQHGLQQHGQQQHGLQQHGQQQHGLQQHGQQQHGLQQHEQQLYQGLQNEQQIHEGLQRQQQELQNEQQQLQGLQLQQQQQPGLQHEQQQLQGLQLQHGQQSLHLLQPIAAQDIYQPNQPISQPKKMKLRFRNNRYNQNRYRQQPIIQLPLSTPASVIYESEEIPIPVYESQENPAPVFQPQENPTPVFQPQENPTPVFQPQENPTPVFQPQEPPARPGPLGCKTPMPCLNPRSLPMNVTRTWLDTPRTLYATVSSCWGYNQLASVHLGREVQSQQELEGMCPTQFFRNGTGFFSGFGLQFQKRCIPSRDGGFVCVNVGGSGDPGQDLTIQSILTSYLVGTDNRSYGLFYRCVAGFADYVVLTSRPYIDKPAALQAVGQILGLGFPESEIKFLPCKP